MFNENTEISTSILIILTIRLSFITYYFLGILYNSFLEVVLNCLFEGLRVKNFSFDRFFQGR